MPRGRAAPGGDGADLAGRPGRGAGDPRAAARRLFLAGRPITFTFAELHGFNLRGGLQLYPEFVALVFGLVTYTAGFIAEIVRAGVARGLARADRGGGGAGAAARAALRLIVVPQALRLIIPPLTSQWLNIVKNSSLAVFIGYPDLVLIVRRHGAQPDPCGDAGDGDHDGRLSRDLAGDLLRAQPRSTRAWR